jgi:flagellar FliL protein
MATRNAKTAPAAPAAAKEAAANATPQKKNRKLIPILIAVLVLLAGSGGGVWWFVKHSSAEAADGEDKSASDGKKGDDKKPAPVFVTLEPFTVNLQDEDASRYLQVGIVFEVGANETAEAIKQQMPVIRNGILLLLSNKHAQEIATLKGKQALADEIIAATRKPLTNLPEPTRGVQGVYFASFVIQ